MRELLNSPEKTSLFRRLYLYWKFEWKFIPRNTIIGIKNLFKWFKLIWNDRHWDQSYLLTMIKFKIEGMADYHESRKFYVGWENNVKWMRTTCRLIEKVRSEHYQGEHMDYFEAHYWFEPIKDTEYSEFKSETTSEHLDDYIQKYPLQYNKVLKQFNKVTKRECDFDDINDKKMFSRLLGIHNHNRAKSLLFKILNDKIEGWWD